MMDTLQSVVIICVDCMAFFAVACMYQRSR